MATTKKREVAATIESITEHFGTNLHGKKFAVWGLTTSLEINDACHTPGMQLIDWLLANGASVCVHAPNVYSEGPDTYGGDLEFVSGHWNAARKADALVVLSDSDQYRGADAGWLRWHLGQAVIFDAKNCMDAESLNYGSFTYYGVEDQSDMIFSISAFAEEKAALVGNEEALAHAA